MSFLYLQERVQKHCKENEQSQQRTAKIDDSKASQDEMKTGNSFYDSETKLLLTSGENDDWQNSKLTASDRTVNFRRTFHCTYKKRSGHLSLSMESFSFTTAGTDHMHWAYRYSQITEMRKLDESNRSGYKAPKGLCFELIDGVQEEIKVSKGRDEIFSNIVGLSGRAWQHLPALK